MSDQDREILEVDVLFVGAGPAGLSGAIELARLAAADESVGPLTIGVLEKADALGEHNLSGAVVNPRAFHELFPDMDPAEFLITEDLPKVHVTRSDARSRIRYESTSMVAHPLTGPIEGQTLSAACVEWEPGMTDSYESTRTHAGEEFIHVTEGAVEVTVKGRTILLREGDSLHFRADVPHKVVNRFAEPCRAILIMTPVFGF